MNFPLLYLSLCRLVVRLYLDWKADLFFITLGHSLRSQRSACKLMVSEKTKTDLMALFNSHYIYNKCGRRGGLMVSALDSGASGPGSSPGRGHCVVFLGKTLYSHSASLHPGV